MSRHRERSRAAPLGRAVMALGTLAMLGGCVTHGDFARHEPSPSLQRLGFDRYAHVPGYAGAHDLGLPLTEAETELRARAYSLRFTYAHRANHGHWSQYDPVIIDDLPMDLFPDADRYVKTMVRREYQSAEAMMNAIVDDIRADIDHIEAFRTAALTVYGDDAARLAEIERFGTSAEPTARSLARRIADNRFIIEHVMVALAERIEGYERALADVLLAGGREVRAAATLELEGIKRRAARLQADLSHSDGRYALNLPRESECLAPSIARPC